MADPNSIDDLTKVGTSAGAGGLVVALSALVGKFLTSSKLDALTTQLADMSAKMTILVAASERRDGEHDRLDAANRLARLEARVDALERLTDRAVAQ